MPVNEKLMDLGSWRLTLVEETPRTILDSLGYFGHVAFVPGRLEPALYGDQLLTMARYVGVLTGRDVDHIRKTVDGQSMAVWLGDADGKGDVIEAPGLSINATFPNAIRQILGSGTAVVEGTLYSVPGTYRGRHVWQSKRKAIDYICSTMEAEWRVNGDGTLDAGLATDLYDEVPDTVIVRRRPNRFTDGDDLTLHGLRGDMGVATDVDDWTTRLVLLAEGQGDAVVTGVATNPVNPYKDLRGGLVKRTRLVSESTTTPGNAQGRAEYQLSKFTGNRTAMRMTTDDYDVIGAFAVGDWAWVYDPDTGLVDTDNEITFRGERINPVRLRMVGASWPIRRGMTVAYRNKDGAWLDLTPYVDWEGGETTVDVGDMLQGLSNGGTEPVGPRPIPDSTIPGVVTWDLPFESGVYLDSSGTTRARMLVRWELPLNDDGSTILDGDHYEIAYGVSPVTGDEWQTAFAPWGVLQAMVNDLSPGVEYDFRIRAVDTSNNQGAWSVTETALANPDTIPPSTPAAPTVAASLIAIQITHQLGKASGGTFNLELDLDHLEVHVGATSGFTPDETTLRGKVAANAGMMQAEIPAVGTVPEPNTTLRQVKVVAVDQAGNRSDPSAAASVTALLIDDAHISDLTVTKVTAGTISANWLIGASIRTASSGQRVELNTSGLQMYNSGNALLVSLAPTGTFFLRSGTTGARIDLSTVTGLQIYNSGGVRTAWLDVSGSFELRSGSSGARIELDTSGLRAYNSGGTQTVNISASSGDVTIVGQFASGVSGRRIIVNPSGTTDPEIRFVPASGSVADAFRMYCKQGGFGEGFLRMEGVESNFMRSYAQFGQGGVTEIGAIPGDASHDTWKNVMTFGTGLADGGRTRLVGMWHESATERTAMIPGSVAASGSTGLVDYDGFYVPSYAAIMTPKAGNPVGHAVTAQSGDNFTWTVSVALSGSDRINYWVIRTSL
ncbi:fibronectin type III domain-containing protein [Nonomuraea bangladeshensis]|uniref:Fibronectin type III domain-containing protein n=1 Tax=Nonomuraea bangladeshensis TaxID=404385 RepID=A0ABV3H4H6_9ACTN